MTLPQIADMIIVVSAIISIYFLVKLYQLTRNYGIFILIFAFGYIGMFRLLAATTTITQSDCQSLYVLPFWLVLPLGIIRLYESIKKAFRND